MASLCSVVVLSNHDLMTKYHVRLIMASYLFIYIFLFIISSCSCWDFEMVKLNRLARN